METSGKAEDLNTNELINHLLKQLESKDRQMEQLNQTIANLTETINELKRKIFGISSEKSANVSGIDGQLSLFDPLGIDEPVQVPETISVASHEKKKSRATHEELARYVPITTIDLDLEGAALNCPTVIQKWRISVPRWFVKRSELRQPRSSVSSMYNTAMPVRYVVMMGKQRSRKLRFQRH